MANESPKTQSTPAEQAKNEYDEANPDYHR